MSQAVVLAGTGSSGLRELPMSAAMFALVSIIVFVALLGLTWTFRGSSNKHD